MVEKLEGFLYIRERKECRACRYFSKQLAWWDWLMIPVAYRRFVVGKCIRPRQNWNEYVVVIEPKKHCKYYRE